MQASEKNESSSLTIVISCLWLAFPPCGHLALDGPICSSSLRRGKFGKFETVIPSMHQSGPRVDTLPAGVAISEGAWLWDYRGGKPTKLETGANYFWVNKS